MGHDVLALSGESLWLSHSAWVHGKKVPVGSAGPIKATRATSLKQAGQENSEKITCVMRKLSYPQRFCHKLSYPGHRRQLNICRTKLQVGLGHPTWPIQPFGPFTLSGLPPSSHMQSLVRLEEQTDPSQSIKCSSTELASDWQGCQC